MPARTTGPSAKNKVTKNKKTEPVQPPIDRFPFAQYASVLGTSVRFHRGFDPGPIFDAGLDIRWACSRRSMVGELDAKWSFEETAKGTEVEIKLDRAWFDGLRLTRFKEATALTLCAALPMHVVVVVFGAPVTTHILQTALLSSVVTILTAFTPALILGMPSLALDTVSTINLLTWTRLFAELSPRNTLECTIVYPVVGCLWAAGLALSPLHSTGTALGRSPIGSVSYLGTIDGATQTPHSDTCPTNVADEMKLEISRTQSNVEEALIKTHRTTIIQFQARHPDRGSFKSGILVTDLPVVGLASNYPFT
ncbi:hypothetical protein V8E55_002743 [Tylopilus felleus]